MNATTREVEQPPGDKNVSLYICLSFFPNEYLVSAISQLVSDFCQIGLRDLDISSRFHMAAHELAEVGGEHTLSVRTCNQAAPDRIVELEQRLQELKTTSDPVALYDRMIEQSAPLEGVSGLGLARIRAEGGLDFDYRIEGNEVTLVVQSLVPKPPPLGPDEQRHLAEGVPRWRDLGAVRR